MSRRYKKNRKQVRILIGCFVCLLLVMTAGYAAFSTNISLSAKGNIKEITAAWQLKQKIVTSGDGIYLDTDEDGSYVYRGADPDNYICLAGDSCSTAEMYRIVSIEADNTLKVIKNTSIGDIVYDPGYYTVIEGVTDASSREGTRYTDNSSDYCYHNDGAIGQYYGCALWGSKTTMRDLVGNVITSMPNIYGSNILYELPETEAYLNTYLNNEFYNSLSEDIKDKIVVHSFDVGHVLMQKMATIRDGVIDEKKYTWQGRIGLISVTEYMRASTYTGCSTMREYYNSSDCYSNSSQYNYLFQGQTMWTITKDGWYVYAGWNLSEEGRLTDPYILNKRGVRPAFYLKEKIRLSGKGTLLEPYTIIEV